ncbi:hypothetical protein HYW54_03245 [Candidatus Gottesmanbacteria bacterium]|nr:hypothetical protein [Candidatus Gottesmanbacteria bacterium]
MNNLLPIAILICGLYLVFAGYKTIQEKRVKFLPLNRNKLITGEAAVKEGKKFFAIGVITILISIILFVFSR